MATLNSKTNSNRKSYLLSVTPIDYSLTDGTSIPPPSPQKQSPLEPPANGGGPLTSHPATPPTPPNGEVQQAQATSNHSTTMQHVPGTDSREDRADSFHTPTSPASNAQYSSSPQDRRNRPSGVRRLFSLTNLRSSFSSSRTSLSQPRPSHDTFYSQQQQQPGQYNGVKRPSSPSMASTTATSTSRTPASTLRQKKSGGNWFKRKSGFFTTSMNGELEAVEERERERPETRDSKRLKENNSNASPAPFLPEIGALKGGSVSGGDLGWDERAFKR